MPVAPRTRVPGSFSDFFQSALAKKPKTLTAADARLGHIVRR